MTRKVKVFSGNYNTVKGQYVTRELVSGFQDLRLVYFERGFYNPILDVNGNEVQPGDASYGTVYKPYVSYIHFKDKQSIIFESYEDARAKWFNTPSLLKSHIEVLDKKQNTKFKGGFK